MHLTVGVYCVVLIIPCKDILNIHRIIGQFRRNIDLLITVVAPGGNIAVLHYDGVMVTPALNLDGLGAECRQGALAMCGNTPGKNGTVILQCCNRVCGSRNGYHAALGARRNIGC